MVKCGIDDYYARVFEKQLVIAYLPLRLSPAFSATFNLWPGLNYSARSTHLLSGGCSASLIVAVCEIHRLSLPHTRRMYSEKRQYLMWGKKRVNGTNDIANNRCSRWTLRGLDACKLPSTRMYVLKIPPLLKKTPQCRIVLFLRSVMTDEGKGGGISERAILKGKWLEYIFPSSRRRKWQTSQP